MKTTKIELYNLVTGETQKSLAKGADQLSPAEARNVIKTGNQNAEKNKSDWRYRIKESLEYVVIDNHTLGYLIPGSRMAGVLSTSPIKGNPHTTLIGSLDPVLIGSTTIVRPATLKDFKEFRHSPKGHLT